MAGKRIKRVRRKERDVAIDDAVLIWMAEIEKEYSDKLAVVQEEVDTLRMQVAMADKDRDYYRKQYHNVTDIPTTGRAILTKVVGRLLAAKHLPPKAMKTTINQIVQDMSKYMKELDEML